MYSGGLINQASLALALWSYLPLYTFVIAIGGCLLKMPIEVRDRRRSPNRSGELMCRFVFQEQTILEDPELGNQYRLYKIKVPYRIIPYIW